MVLVFTTRPPAKLLAPLSVIRPPDRLKPPLPVTTLLVDERGMIEHCISAAGSVLGDATAGIEGRALAALLGVRSGDDCLHQVTRTLNTSRPGLVTVELDTQNGHHWVECRSTLLRGRPGAAPRASP